MKSYFKLLSFYSLLVTTGLFIASLFYIPRPENFLFLLLFFPTAVFFWLKGPNRLDKEGSPTTTIPPQRLAFVALIILTVLFISNLTLYTYLKWGKNSLKINNSEGFEQSQTNSQALREVQELIEDLQNKEASNQSFSKDIEQLQSEIADLKSTDSLKAEIMGIAESSISSQENTLLRFVTINTKKWQTLDVFKNKSSTSSVIAQIEYGKNYPFTQKEPGWYKITLPDNRLGWVKDQYLKEVIPGEP